MKPLSKITVSEIVADCNINRKTFYYHFEDVQSLLKWTLEQ
ncbi:TetR family transcriptional regulator [Ruminococcus sp.]|nr:TetR family transcriptional regulator [Ruminococcus sp.]